MPRALVFRHRNVLDRRSMRAVLSDLPKEAITGACTRQATARWHIVEGLDGELYARCHKDTVTEPLLQVIVHRQSI